MNRTIENLSLFLLSLLVSAPFADATEKPNVIFMLADDLGYGDLSCYNPQTKGEENVKGLSP